MTWLAVSLALASSPATSPAAPWRLLATPAVHVGLRPAAFVDNEDGGRLEGGAGASVQVTAWFVTL